MSTIAGSSFVISSGIVILSNTANMRRLPSKVDRIRMRIIPGSQSKQTEMVLLSPLGTGAVQVMTHTHLNCAPLVYSLH